MGSAVSKVKSRADRSSKKADKVSPATESPAVPDQKPTPPPNSKHTLPAQDIFSFTSKIHHDTYAEIDPATESPCAGKAVLVTGSNRGIGLAILLSYARAGASRIAICTRRPNPTIPEHILHAATEAGHPEPTVILLQLDVTIQEEVDAAAREVEAQWGRLDILINNAGYMAEDAFEPLGRSVWKEWEHSMDVNLLGAARVTRAFLPLMLKGGDKTIINLASIGSLYAEGGGESYSLAKFALCRLSEFLCAGHKEEGVLSYSIHPGGIDTPLARNMPPEFHHLLCDTETLAGDSIVFLTHKRRPWLGGRWINCNWDMPELMAKEAQIVEHDLLKFKCQGLI